MADHPRLVLVNTPHMSARTAVVAEVRVRRILSYVRQIVPAFCVRHAGQLGIAAMMVRSYFSDGACSLSGSAVTLWIRSGRSLFTVQTCPHLEQR